MADAMHAQVDQYRALLSTLLAALEAKTPGRISQIIAQVEREYHEENEDMGAKLHALAALVGITTTMQLEIELKKGGG